jgi:hypothetical protein
MSYGMVRLVRGLPSDRRYCRWFISAGRPFEEEHASSPSVS